MAHIDLDALDRRMKWRLLIVSALAFVVLIILALRDNAYVEWRYTRLEYADILAQKATTPREQAYADNFRIIIDQNYLPDLDKADRCITCHTGMEDPRMADQVNPFRTHPRDLLSQHPPGEFGCTVCHEGQGRATDSKAAHGYDENWSSPLLAKGDLYSTCATCHGEQVLYEERDRRADGNSQQDAQEESNSGPEKILLGYHLIEQAGCAGCHLIAAYAGWRKVGPSLRRLATKTTREWAYHFIEDPSSFRNHTWMPSYFGESNNLVPESRYWTHQEVLAAVEYLFSVSEAYDLEALPEGGDAIRGKSLVGSLGCLGCHLDADESLPDVRTLNSLRREMGPRLSGLGSKTTAQWTYNWLRNPHAYSPLTKMADLMLSEQEAADIAAYLILDQVDDSKMPSLPTFDHSPEGALNEMARLFMVQDQQETEALVSVTAMSEYERVLFVGKKVIEHYGCAGCHDIPGVEEANLVGAPLDGISDRNIRSFDFAGLSDIGHTTREWLFEKMMDPRIFDRAQIKTQHAKLRMPNFAFTEAESDAIVTALMSFRSAPTSTRLVVAQTPLKRSIRAGHAIVRQFNCKGCHSVAGDGGAIAPTIVEWLVAQESYTRAEAIDKGPTFSAPDLLGLGKKVRSQWLFDYMIDPGKLRPWLTVRMPRHNLRDEQVNTLLEYFSSLDGELYPFARQKIPESSGAQYEAGKLLFSSKYFDCGSCHIQGDKLPAGPPETWAPDFALTRSRLKPEWILRWMYDPQKVAPGTKMPTYFPEEYFDDAGPPDILGGDEHRQIAALREYIRTLHNATQAAPSQETRLHEEISEVEENGDEV